MKYVVSIIWVGCLIVSTTAEANLSHFFSKKMITLRASINGVEGNLIVRHFYCPPVIHAASAGLTLVGEPLILYAASRILLKGCEVKKWSEFIPEGTAEEAGAVIKKLEDPWLNKELTQTLLNLAGRLQEKVRDEYPLTSHSLPIAAEVTVSLQYIDVKTTRTEIYLSSYYDGNAKTHTYTAWVKTPRAEISHMALSYDVSHEVLGKKVKAIASERIWIEEVDGNCASLMAAN